MPNSLYRQKARTTHGSQHAASVCPRDAAHAPGPPGVTGRGRRPRSPPRWGHEQSSQPTPNPSNPRQPLRRARGRARSERGEQGAGTARGARTGRGAGPAQLLRLLPPLPHCPPLAIGAGGGLLSSLPAVPFCPHTRAPALPQPGPSTSRALTLRAVVEAVELPLRGQGLQRHGSAAPASPDSGARDFLPRSAPHSGKWRRRGGGSAGTP